MKNIKFFAMAIASIMAFGSITLVSCDKEENVINQSADSYYSQSATKMNQTDGDKFAQELSTQMGASLSAFSELNAMVDIVRSYGRDEYVPLVDIASPSSSVFSTNFYAPNLRNIITNALLSQYNLSLEEDYYDNLILYWPYHDDWDEETIPVICFAGSNQANEQLMGYVYQDGASVERIMSVEDIDECRMPVIIISKNEYRYSDYPDFKSGCNTKNGVIWGKAVPIEYNPVLSDLSPISGDTVYEARGYSFTCSGKQYDLVWAGGNDYRFSIGYVTPEGVADTVCYCFELTRKEVKQKITVDVDIPIHPNWQSSCGNVYFDVREHDEWGWISPIIINLDYNNSSISTTIDVNSTDDDIFSGLIYRPNYFNRCLNEDGVFIFGREKLCCNLRIYENNF